MLRFGEGRPWRRASVRESEGDMASADLTLAGGVIDEGEAGGKGKKRGRRADAAAPDSKVLSVYHLTCAPTRKPTPSLKVAPEEVSADSVSSQNTSPNTLAPPPSA